MQRERIPVTSEGLQKLKEELNDLITRQRPEIVRAIAQAREEGDLRENAGYDAAKNDQGFIEARIKEIEQVLKRVELIDSSGASSGDGKTVRVGSTVTVEIDGVEEKYTIVGAVEAKPREGRISNESPVGRALLGKRVGQQISIKTPAATLAARVVRVES